jgi:hypothetical protein
VRKREHEERGADDKGDKEEDDTIVAESREQHKQLGGVVMKSN